MDIDIAKLHKSENTIYKLNQHKAVGEEQNKKKYTDTSAKKDTVYSYRLKLQYKFMGDTYETGYVAATLMAETL